ncbi:hypothetical protein VNO77_31445 [Canavalia gladiata]|uniref:Uncharacterized protein n=1 Tax=Canavalia gladiata TaxID=3824 RepID=A0AAN9Q3Z0_CANGL
MLAVSLTHNALFKYQTRLHGKPLSSLSHSSSFLGSPLILSRSTILPGNQALSRNQFVVFPKKITGLEEAMNIRKERELQVVTKVKKRPPLRHGRISPCRPVPDHIPRPPYVGSNTLPGIASKHQIQDSDGIAKMRAACELAARVLNFAGTLVGPSLNT